MRTSNNLRFTSICTSVIFAVAIITSQAGCSGGSISAESISTIVGDMNDTSYYGHRGQTFRPNAQGEMVCIDQYEGKFLWADYAAPWCPACKPQTRDILQLDGRCGEDVVFLTVMTSDMKGYGNPATRETAARWSKAFGLDRTQVLAADLTATTIPKHILFSPDGQVLFEKTGQMGASEIRSTLTRCKQQWEVWKSSSPTR